MIRLIIPLIFIANTLVAAQVPSKQAPAFVAKIKAMMETYKVPGLGIALIKEGHPIWVGGLGVRDIDSQTPVDAHTTFAIGSTSKAFTATALGILADQGKLNFDDPIQTWLPNFKLQDPVASAQANLVDLLSHRSGLPRHDLMWYGSQLSRHDIFQRLQYLQPRYGFREKWLYNNLMVMVAGHVAGAVTNSSWEAVIQNEIMTPLAMSDASVSVSGLKESSNAAAAHAFDNSSGQLKVIPYRNLDAVGPAGSINASASDMIPWLQLQLEGGVFQDQKIIDAKTLARIHFPIMVVQMAPFPEWSALSYGLGWMNTYHRGQRLVLHNGAIDGFRAIVAFMPSEKLGVALLTNSEATDITQALLLTVIDHALGHDGNAANGNAANANTAIAKDWTQVFQLKVPKKGAQTLTYPTSTALAHQTNAYVGTFHNPAYGAVIIRTHGEKLSFEFSSFSGNLLHYAPDRFYGQDDGGAFPFQFIDIEDNVFKKLKLGLEPQLKGIDFERI